MRRMSRMARWLAVVSLAALLLAGCGGSGTSPKASPSSQGFIPAPAQTSSATTSKTTATTTASPTLPSAAQPTPTPFATPDVAASAQANDCAITSFAKGGPPQVQAALYSQWYGSGDLWFAPASYYAGSSLRDLSNASVWFQGIVPTVALATQAPKVTGHLKGDPATTLTATPGSASPIGGIRPQEEHDINISFPQPGCWQVSLASGNQTLNVTIWVVPLNQRPDVANLLASRKSETPYPPPASCSVTTWNGPADHGAPYSADYQITGQGMNLDTLTPVYFATQSDLFVVYGNFPNQPNLTGQLKGSSTAVVRSSWEEYAGQNGSGWRGTILFSTPGCWQISVTEGTAKVDLTLYIYPVACAPPGNSTQAQPCKAPE